MVEYTLIQRALLVGLVGPWACLSASDNLAFEVMSPVVRLEAPQLKGTGFAVARGNLGTYLMTNAHVVQNLHKINVKIFYWNRKKTRIMGWYMVEGKVIVQDVGRDLALVLIPRCFKLPVVEFRDVPLSILDPAIAVGCGKGQDPQIYRGVIIDQDWDCEEGEPSCTDLVQTDCHIVGGCSGGPLFVQHEGKWVVTGVMCAGFPGTRMTYAIPAKKVLEFLAAYGTM